jgi:hypothetical protein
MQFLWREREERSIEKRRREEKRVFVWEVKEKERALHNGG